MSQGDVLPAGYRFAFTILDDTDDARVENVEPIYRLLFELGFRTTKTVWPVGCPEGSAVFFAGDTLEDPEYRRFCLRLQEQGFELSWHSATMESSKRPRVIAALEEFERVFGAPPRIHTNHAENQENIYWGEDRYRTPLLRWFARRRGEGLPYEGELEGSEYFWGDLCKQRFPYARNFTFYRLNTREADPYFPYTLPSTPYVNGWFSTSDAADVEEFRRLVTAEGLDELRKAGGICILSTHLGKGFVREGRVDPVVERVLRHLAQLEGGWFVPAGTLLDHLTQVRGLRALARRELFNLELRHAVDRVRGLRRG